MTSNSSEGWKLVYQEVINYLTPQRQLMFGFLVIGAFQFFLQVKKQASENVTQLAVFCPEFN